MNPESEVLFSFEDTKKVVNAVVKGMEILEEEEKHETDLSISELNVERSASKLEVYILEPRDNELFLDWDNWERVDLMDKWNRILEPRGYNFHVAHAWNSGSKPDGWHVIARLRYLSTEPEDWDEEDGEFEPEWEDVIFEESERIAWQLLLGSDPAREFVDMLRTVEYLYRDCHHGLLSVFFESKSPEHCGKLPFNIRQRLREPRT